jgi:hypothetical protein
VLEHCLKTQRIQFLTGLSSEFHDRDWQLAFSNGEFQFPNGGLLLPNGELELNHRLIANFQKADIDLV